jgi:HEAT repeat protein
MRAALAVLVLFVGAPARAADKPEPKYEGKPLAYWVQRFQKAENDKDRDTAVEALKAFGPDAAPALPALIDMLADHSLNYRARVIGIVATIGPKAQSARPIIVKLVKDKKTAMLDDSIKAIVAISSDPKDAAEALAPLLETANRADEVYSALCELGPDAKEAIPAIRQYVLKALVAKQKDEARPNYLIELSKLGSGAVPILIESLDAHGGYGRTHALACLEQLGPKATEAVPALVKLLAHDDPATRARSAVTLWKIEKHPAALGALAGLLSADPDIKYNPAWWLRETDSIAVYATTVLGEIGPDAKAALPQLREATALGRTLWLLAGGGDWPSDQPSALAAFTVPHHNKETYRQWRDIADRIRVGVSAEQAIAKIEQKPKK